MLIWATCVLVSFRLIVFFLHSQIFRKQKKKKQREWIRVCYELCGWSLELMNGIHACIAAKPPEISNHARNAFILRFPCWCWWRIYRIPLWVRNSIRSIIAHSISYINHCEMRALRQYFDHTYCMRINFYLCIGGKKKMCSIASFLLGGTWNRGPTLCH